MKKSFLALAFAASLVSAVEAAPNGQASQADLQAILQRLSKLEAENKAQAARIAELEAAAKKPVAGKAGVATTAGNPAKEEGTTISDSGRVYTTESGRKFYLADKAAGIFQPLTESGLQFEPYGYLVLEGVHNTAHTDYPMYTDYVRPRGTGHNGDHTSTLSVNDSILGFKIFSPESYSGWKFDGKFEFDLAGANANKTDFHVRHLYWNMEHEDGWQILFGQTWHLWKMVSPNEIDGAWMENTGYPYRRSPQIRVAKKWNWDDSSLEVRAGLVKNGPGMGGDRDGDGTENNEQSAWCLLEGAVVYDHKALWEEDDKRWLIGIGGQYGQDRSRRYDEDSGSFSGKNDDYDSDMVMLAGAVPFGNFTLTGQIFAGENLGGVQAGVGQLVAFRDTTRKGREVSTVGGFIDLRYDLNSQWAFAIGYGFDDPNVSESRPNIDTRGDYAGITYNDRTYVDVFYNPDFHKNLHFGLEYAYLTTDYLESAGKDADDHRFQFTVYYDF